MRLLYLGWLTCVGAACAGCATGHPAKSESLVSSSFSSLESAEAEEIARLEDRRSLGSGRIEALTRAGAPAIRRRALLALGRLQSPETVGVVAAALDDPDLEVRIMAAFALGELGVAFEPAPESRRSLAEERLLQRLATETERRASEAVIEALGKIGGQSSLEPLASALLGRNAERAAIALALIAKRSDAKLVSAGALSILRRLLESPSDSVRFAAAYALMRSHDPGSRGALAGCANDKSAEVRAVCVRALADFVVEQDLPLLSNRMEDEDIRVASEAARGIAKQIAACPASPGCAALEALRRSRAPWPAHVAAAIAAEPLAGPASAELFAERVRDYQARAATATDPLAKSTLLRSACQAALAHDRAAGEIVLLAECGPGAIDAAERGALKVRALAEGKGAQAPRLDSLLALAGQGSSVPAAIPDQAARVAAARALARFPDAPQSRAAIRRLLGDPDPVVAAAAAEAVETARLVEAGPELVAMLSSESKAEEVVGAALSAIAALKLEEAREEVRRLALEGPVATRRAAVRALEALGETSLPDTPAWEPGPYSGERLPERPYVRLTTSRGAIRVLLYARDSPLTVRNFAGLVRKGFYNGLKFHRVVPDFVAQGGDPRGDGFGGPGYSIRCEVNDRRFVAGSLGMALSGKDTGGSQFFFTVSPQPHLDGRHTNFGEIVEGFEVAMALIEGDRIIDAVVEGDRLPLDGRAGEGYTSAVQR